jgi:hypothetical protein
MKIREFALFAQNYAVRVSDFVRQPSFALNSLARARLLDAYARVFLWQSLSVLCYNRRPCYKSYYYVRDALSSFR